MNVALVGIGAMGKHHYRVLRESKQADLVAVCDPRIDWDMPERVYPDVRAMLAKEHLGAVVVAVPTSHHLAVASLVIERGIPLLIEKPVASTPDEACKLIDLVHRHETQVVVGHVERFNPVVRALKTALIGKEVYSITITRIGPFPPRIKDVGVLVDLSVHDIDLVRLLTGGAEIGEARVYKSTKRVGHHEDNAVVTIRLQNDVVATIVTNWLTPFKKRTIEIATDQAFFSADLMTQELTEYSAYTEDNSYVVKKAFVRKGEPLKGEVEAFLTYARTGDRDGLASLEDGLFALETIHRSRALTSNATVVTSA